MCHRTNKYKKIAAIFVAMCLAVTGCSKAEEEKSNDIDSVTLKSNQEIVAAKITAIYGNEIEYTVVKEQSASDLKKDSMPSGSGAPDMNGKGMQGSGNPPDMNGNGMQGGGNAPDMNGNGMQGGGNAPDMNGGDSKSGNTSQDKNSSSSSSTDNKSLEKKSLEKKSSENSNKKIYTLTEETGSTTIPVGTDVITSLGKTTTFSRISNGDIVKMIMEKDSDGNKVVVGVWIVS